jgi:hypothetical protein
MKQDSQQIHYYLVYQFGASYTGRKSVKSFSDSQQVDQFDVNYIVGLMSQ